MVDRATPLPEGAVNVASWDESTPPSTAAAVAVAEAQGVDPCEMQQLYRFVDPDALDALFVRQSAASVAFGLSGYEVLITSDGTVVVFDQTSESTR
ncbi:HalOD1 output domain-containing protein [Haloprofundus salilacus]|uniref:HalOD1 output domain-containing protein n=1 Tax=Haloprofundus salilacus TaxID=2876190 RepID=UPI001CCECA66|nr:HalOD1 output domain-containing protein [Haloprofundus salilacus]